MVRTGSLVDTDWTMKPTRETTQIAFPKQGREQYPINRPKKHHRRRGVSGHAAPGVSLASTDTQLQQHAETDRQLRQALQEADILLAQFLDSTTFLDEFLECIARIVPYDLGCVLLIESRQWRIARVKSAAKYNTVLVNQEQLAIDLENNPYLKQIQDTRTALIIPDAKLAPGWPKYPGAEDLRSWISVPVYAHDELVAIFILGNDRAFHYTGEHERQLFAFASRAALALKNAQLFESIQRRAREAEMLRLAAAAVITELDLDHVLERILINLKKVVHYDNAAILLLEDERLIVVADEGYSPENKAIGKTLPADNAYFRQALTSGRPLIQTGAVSTEHAFELTESIEIHSRLGVPLQLRGRAIGFLTIDSRLNNAYSEVEATLAQAFANEATIALENARLFKELQSLATIDPLTQIWNRRHFFHLAKIEYQRARRYRQPLSVILFDIDSFKVVNDTFGHPIGDEVLRSVAKLCLENIRQVDILGRYGGEEFIALLPNTTRTQARQVAERLRRRLAQTTIPTQRGPVQISASFGVAELDDTCQDVDTLLIYADRAAYAAKDAGKNRVSFAQDDFELDI